MNTVSKIYESALKTQNEKKNENMSQMQTVRRKPRFNNRKSKAK